MNIRSSFIGYFIFSVLFICTNLTNLTATMKILSPSEVSTLLKKNPETLIQLACAAKAYLDLPRSQQESRPTIEEFYKTVEAKLHSLLPQMNIVLSDENWAPFAVVFSNGLLAGLFRKRYNIGFADISKLTVEQMFSIITSIAWMMKN